MTEQDIARAYLDGASMNDLVRMTGKQRKQLSFILTTNGVRHRDRREGIAAYKKRSGQGEDDFNARYVPTEEEIERETRRIRSRWNERERVSRIVGPPVEAAIQTIKCFRHNGKTVNNENY